jgi:hypothetical protein
MKDIGFFLWLVLASSGVLFWLLIVQALIQDWMRKRYAESVEEKRPEQLEQPMRRPGPYRAKPEVDVELLGAHGELLTSVPVELVVKIAATGLLVTTAGPIDFRITRQAVVHSWQFWLGDECLRSPQTHPAHVGAGDTFRLNSIEIPVKVGPGIWFGPGSNDGGDAPQPTPPLPQSGQKERVR